MIFVPSLESNPEVNLKQVVPQREPPLSLKLAQSPKQTLKEEVFNRQIMIFNMVGHAHHVPMIMLEDQ